MFYACVGSRRWVRRPFDPACMPQSGFYLGLFVRATTTNAQIFPLSSQRPTLLPERLPSALPPSAISAPLYQDLYYNNMKSVACVLALAGSAAAFAPAGTSSSVGFLSGFVRISLFRLGISLRGRGSGTHRGIVCPTHSLSCWFGPTLSLLPRITPPGCHSVWFAAVGSASETRNDD